MVTERIGNGGGDGCVVDGLEVFRHGHGADGHRFVGSVDVAIGLDRQPFLGADGEPADKLLPEFLVKFDGRWHGNAPVPRTAGSEGRDPALAIVLHREDRFAVRLAREQGQCAGFYPGNRGDTDQGWRLAPKRLVCLGIERELSYRMRAKAQHDPGLVLLVGIGAVIGGNLHRQHLGDRRVGVLTEPERIDPAKHQQTATTGANKFLEHFDLVGREVGGLDIAEDDGLKGIELLDGRGNPFDRKASLSLAPCT